nr:hypothetical protein [Tanacetum cinerariifolium]
MLYDGNVIKNTYAITIPDSKETLMLAEESRSKMILKQQDPMVLEKKVNTTPNSMNSSDPSPSCTPIRVEFPKELPKKVNDVVQLRTLIDGKKVVVSKDFIIRDIRLDDVDGVECLLNEEIFAELARMGYEKPPPKLTFYKAFSSAQWKFLIHTLVYMVRNVDSPSKILMYLQFLQVVINNQMDDLTSHNTRYTSTALTQKVFANMRRVGKGFSGVETPLFASMLVSPQPQATEEEQVTGRIDQDDVNAASKGVSFVEPTIFDDEEVTMTMAQTLIKLKAEKPKLLDEQMV